MPNVGHKASIILEELKEAYGKDYTFQSINIAENVQKEQWFTSLCPNGRIPVIVDHDRNDFAVFEGLGTSNVLLCGSSCFEMLTTTKQPFSPI